MRSISQLSVILSSLVLMMSFGLAQEGNDSLPAFPGAEGFGAVSKGGRGGKVLKVTNLNPDGPGSFQWACSQEFPRIVVFEVSGVITPTNRSKGKNWLAIKPSYITIAGQTAPGAGITINGMVSTYRSCRNAEKDRKVSDLIIRFIRIRPTSPGGGRGSNLRGMENKASRTIFDHVSASWSTDDCFCVGPGPVTVQWCAVEESDIHLEGGDEPHNFAMLMTGRNPQPLTIHHTLIAHHNDRTPACGTAPTDFRNNVIYNGGGGYFGHRTGTISIVGNYIKPGPGGLVGWRAYRPPNTVGNTTISFKNSRNVYADGNYWNFNGGYVELWKGSTKEKDHDAHPPVKTHTAGEAYELVLANAGAFPRDAVTQRTVAETATGTGARGVNMPAGGFMEGLTPASPLEDSDDDGMPDVWEKAHGLDPNDGSDFSKIVPAGASRGDRHKGYTYIEFYINELADIKTAKALTRARLATVPPGPWDKPADGLPAGSAPHKSLDDIISALKEQDAARHMDRRKKYRTSSAWYAVEQLSRMGEKAVPAVPELVRMLEKGKEDPRQTCFAAWALGAIGPAAKDAVPALIKALEAEQLTEGGKWSFKPYGFIAWALGRIGTASQETAGAVPALARTMFNSDTRSHNAAAWALSRLGPVAASAADDLLKALSKKGFPVLFAARHAGEALAGIGAPAVPGLITVLQKGDSVARYNACRALKLMGPKGMPALQELIKSLDALEPSVRCEAARAIARIAPADDRVIAALSRALRDKQYGVRATAAELLGKCSPSAGKAVDALAQALSDERKEVCRAAALSLGKIGKGGVSVLIKGTGGDSADHTRIYCVRALGHAGRDRETAQAVDALIKALEDSNARVRREAVWALGLIGPGAKSAYKALERSAEKDPDYIVAGASAEVLDRIAGSQ